MDRPSMDATVTGAIDHPPELASASRWLRAAFGLQAS